MTKLTKCLSGLIMIGTCLVIWLYFIPLYTKATTTTRNISKQTAILNQMKFKVAKLPRLEQRLTEANLAEANLEQSFPATLTIAEVYYQLDLMALKSGLKIKQIATKQSPATLSADQRLKYIPIAIEGTGDLAQVYGFFGFNNAE